MPDDRRLFSRLTLFRESALVSPGRSVAPVPLVCGELIRVVADDAWNTSERYEDPDQLLRRITPEPTPISDLRSIGFGQNAEEFRERLARAMVDEQVSEAKVLDMLLAATEVAKNAIEYGGGVEDVRIGRAEGRFVCEVTDRGPGFDDPAAGYLAPRPGAGTGLWVARQLTWQIEFFRSSAGFTARLWALADIRPRLGRNDMESVRDDLQPAPVRRIRDDPAALSDFRSVPAVTS